MKRIVLFFSLFAFTSSLNATEIKWMTWSEAVEANKKKPKMIFVDVYTAWCGWCKVMDTKTFAVEEVAKYMSDHFYCVKFDAEQKEDVTYRKQVYKYNTQYRSHELAVNFLDGQMSYPSFVIFDKNEKRLEIIKGYIEVEPWMAKLKTIVGK
ncbi:MAG: thioredoxin family protein [Flavobacteriales bacterium]